MRSALSPLIPVIVWAFFLPLQTRYFLWQPEINGGVVEYAVVSLYLLPILCFVWFSVSSFFWGDLPAERDNSSRAITVWWVVATIAVTVCFLVSSLLAVDPSLSLGFLANILTAGLFAVTLFDRRIALQPVLLAFVLGLLPSISLGIYQVVFGSSPAITFFGLAARDALRPGDAVLLVGDTRILRAYGFFPHPNIFGGYLAIALVGVAYLWSQSRRFFYGLLFATLFGGLLLTASRSAFLGLVCGLFSLIVFFYCTAKYRRLTTFFTLSVSMALFIGLFAAPGLLSSVRGGGALEQKSVSERVAGITDLPILSPTRFLLGAGPGNTPAALHALHPAWEAWRLQPPHIVSLVILIEFGVFTVGFLMVVLGYGMVFLYRRFLPEDRLYLAWLHVLIPIAFFDHYLVTLYSGMVLVSFVWVFSLRGRMM
ncbi:hypothetical protein KBC55_04375 [Patescibacteria group bacterium]|nr:hypothetical protein [Patescibacteria group bacterium]